MCRYFCCCASPAEPGASGTVFLLSRICGTGPLQRASHGRSRRRCTCAADSASLHPNLWPAVGTCRSTTSIRIWMVRSPRPVERLAAAVALSASTLRIRVCHGSCSLSLPLPYPLALQIELQFAFGLAGSEWVVAVAAVVVHSKKGSVALDSWMTQNASGATACVQPSQLAAAAAAAAVGRWVPPSHKHHYFHRRRCRHRPASLGACLWVSACADACAGACAGAYVGGWWERQMGHRFPRILRRSGSLPSANCCV
jgi:hypothetical protein